MVPKEIQCWSRQTPSNRHPCLDRSGVAAAFGILQIRLGEPNMFKTQKPHQSNTEVL